MESTGDQHGVREVLTQLTLLRRLIYAPGSTQDTVLAEVENALVAYTHKVAILRKVNNLRNLLRNKKKEAYDAYEAVDISERNVIGHVPPLLALTLENLMASARLSRYYVAHFVTYFTKEKVSSVVTYTTGTAAAISFMWVFLLSFTTDNGFIKKQYFLALPFIKSTFIKGISLIWRTDTRACSSPEGKRAPPPHALLVSPLQWRAIPAAHRLAAGTRAHRLPEDDVPVAKAPIVTRQGRTSVCCHSSATA
jgi:hypothetical protein